MLKAYKYRIYPNDAQKAQLELDFNGARFVYNLGLETKIQTFLGTKKNLTYFDTCAQLQDLKNCEQGKFLKDCGAVILQASLKNLDSAYNRFFKGFGFPKFKSKKQKQSIQSPVGVKVNFKDGLVSFPNLKWLKCVFSKQFTGKIKTCTITKTKTDKYFISILVDNGLDLPKKVSKNSTSSVGLDFGVKTFITTSENKQYPNLKFLSKNLNKLKIEQRTLQRRYNKNSKNQSKNWYKQKLKIALLYEKITNQKKDYLHKISTEIINQYDTIVIEDLSIKNMVKDKKFAKLIPELGWFEFSEMLKYKAEWKGKNLIKIGRFDNYFIFFINREANFILKNFLKK
jgi:putative transposase